MTSPVSADDVQLRFDTEVWYWRGPAPFYFARVPDDLAVELHEVAGRVTYGWGMVPATVTIGATTWETALWPKDGSYVVPLKAWVRKAEGIDDGEPVSVELVVAVPAG